MNLGVSFTPFHPLPGKDKKLSSNYEEKFLMNEPDTEKM